MIYSKLIGPFYLQKSFSLRELNCEAARVVWHILLIRLITLRLLFLLKSADSMWTCSKKQIFCVRRVSEL